MISAESAQFSERITNNVNLTAGRAMHLWQLLGSLACSALLAEARLTPKPALVDERGSGAHFDLTLEKMVNSALALEPFFQEMARLSAGAQPCINLREGLAECGRDAEIAMRKATGGSNSHRGAIWCIGLLVSAASIHEGRASEEEIAATAAMIASYADTKAKKQDTHGLTVRRSYGAGGARAEAQSGFPHLTKVGLPHLRRRRLSGASEISCRLDTLLAIMCTLDDTCLLYRGGLPALETAKCGAREVIALGGSSCAAGMTRLFQLDSELVRLMSSPGGSADLLAATIFLDSLDHLDQSNNQDKFLTRRN